MRDSLPDTRRNPGPKHLSNLTAGQSRENKYISTSTSVIECMEPYVCVEGNTPIMLPVEHKGFLQQALL